MSSTSKKYKQNTTKPTNAAEKRRAVRNPKTGRKKTSIACQHCWRSKTRCGIKRPCDRCVRLGHKDCIDRPEATRKRQHINKPKKETIATANTNNTENRQLPQIPHYTFSSNSGSGYIPSSDSGQLPPILSPFNIAMSNLVLPPFPLQVVPNVTSNNCNIGNLSDTTTSTSTTNHVFPPILDPNFGTNIVQNNTVSELMMMDEKKSNKKKSNKKKRKRDKKRKKNKHNRKKHKTIAIDTSDAPPVKKRKINFRDNDCVFGAQQSDGHQADADCCGVDNDEIIYWDQPHKEIDPFSDSSHYSTEYSQDEDDPSLAVIISICQDTQKTQAIELKEAKEERKKDNDSNDDQMSEVWSHYTFTRGQLSKFISVDDNKQSRIHFAKMLSSESSSKHNSSRSQNLERNIYEQIMKDKNINQNLPSIMAPVGMLMDHETESNEIQKRYASLPLFTAIPMNHIFTQHNVRREVLCETIPNWTPAISHISSIPVTPSISSKSTSIESLNANINGFNAFHLQNISNTLSYAPTIARITSLIPAPATNLNIN